MGKEAEMGFFDTVRDKAGALAADAERAGKVTAAQARLVVLQNDLRKVERELGHEAFALIDRGELDHPDLAGTIARLRATTTEVRAKEAEIEALRGVAGPAPEATTVVPAPAAASPPKATPAEPDVQEPASEKPVEKPPAKKAAATKKAPTRKAGTAKSSAEKARAKKAPAGSPAAKKAPVKRAPAAAAVPPAPPREATKAGATPKKSARPSSGPRPAGKKKPAGS
jgi:outer membrane biosynthesis protein TonB